MFSDCLNSVKKVFKKNNCIYLEKKSLVNKLISLIMQS